MIKAQVLKSHHGFDLTPPSAAQELKLLERLDDEQVRILRLRGTEAPFCGVFLDNDHQGTYGCALCGLPLFSSKAKFDSGTGWPSFCVPVDDMHLVFLRDLSHGIERTEIRCSRCDGHLGHVFPDGPPPSFHRYCLNSAALEFILFGQNLPDLLGRGAPEGQPFRGD